MVAHPAMRVNNDSKLFVMSSDDACENVATSVDVMVLLIIVKTAGALIQKQRKPKRGGSLLCRVKLLR